METQKIPFYHGFHRSAIKIYEISSFSGKMRDFLLYLVVLIEFFFKLSRQK